MNTINALGKDGNSILPDLDGASPSGGLVTSESREHVTLRPGTIVREDGAWCVVADVRHNGITGLTTYALIWPDGSAGRSTAPSDTSLEVRTDTRIDPFTLYKLSAMFTARA